MKFFPILKSSLHFGSTAGGLDAGRAIETRYFALPGMRVKLRREQYPALKARHSKALG
jgi:hypothetical protein